MCVSPVANNAINPTTSKRGHASASFRAAAAQHNDRTFSFLAPKSSIPQVHCLRDALIDRKGKLFGSTRKRVGYCGELKLGFPLSLLVSLMMAIVFLTLPYATHLTITSSARAADAKRPIA